MRKIVKEAVKAIYDGFESFTLKESKEQLEIITNELEWLDHYVENVNKLEQEVDELYLENFDLKERIEQLEGKYETDDYDRSRY